jgi:tripartite-type tricarboxylate transporter receptor subunit TctC
VIENRAGAGGVVGTDVVAKSAPDGYTLLVTYAGSQAINPALYPKIPFDSVKDFQTVATLASTPFVLIVHPKLPAKDLAEYVALARAKPDALTYASSGNGSVNHLLGEMLKTEADIKMLHVPYRGVAPAITDVIGGQVDSAFSSVPSVLQMVQTDKVRALAISSAKRIAAAPEIPTIAELGFPGFDVNPWWGILAPAGIDATIVRKINEDVANILRTKEMIDFLAAQGAEPLMTSPEAFLKILEADVVKWAKVVKSAGVTLN